MPCSKGNHCNVIFGNRSHAVSINYLVITLLRLDCIWSSREGSVSKTRFSKRVSQRKCPELSPDIFGNNFVLPVTIMRVGRLILEHGFINSYNFPMFLLKAGTVNERISKNNKRKYYLIH